MRIIPVKTPITDKDGTRIGTVLRDLVPTRHMRAGDVEIDGRGPSPGDAVDQRLCDWFKRMQDNAETLTPANSTRDLRLYGRAFVRVSASGVERIAPEEIYPAPAGDKP